MSESNPYYCCEAQFGKHTPGCKHYHQNAVAQPEPPPAEPPTPCEHDVPRGAWCPDCWKKAAPNPFAAGPRPSAPAPSGETQKCQCHLVTSNAIADKDYLSCDDCGARLRIRLIDESSPVDIKDAAREALVRLECVNRILGDPAADSLDYTTKKLNDVAIRRLRSALAAVREGK